MSGDYLALGLAALLAAAATSRRGSRSVEEQIERPKVLYDLWPKWQREAMEAAVKDYLTEKARMAVLGFGMPPAMLRHFALGGYMKKVSGNTRDIDNFMVNALFDYAAAGRNSFVVGPELQDMLLHTSLDRVERWMLNPPYSAFYIATPESDLRIWGTEPELALVRGLVVDFDYRMNTLGVLIWAPLRNLDRAIERIREDRPETAKVPDAVLRDLFGWLGNDSYLLLDLEEAFSDPEGIEGYLNRSFLEAMASEDWPRAAVQATVQSRVACLKLAIGTILYLQSDKAELSVDLISARAAARRGEIATEIRRTSKPKKKRHLERELEQLPSGPISTWLGKSIEAASRQQEAGTTDRADRRQRKHWVRGHWKVPFAKHKQRQITWVAPYEKGGDPGRVTSRTYRIKP